MQLRTGSFSATSPAGRPGRRVCAARAGKLGGLLGAVLTLAGCGARQPAAVQVSLAGAQIPVELTQSWLQAARPARFSVEQVPPVFLSQHGFENLAAGHCDIACTDRLLTANERRDLFGERSIAGRRVAFYGYAFYVGAGNRLDAIFTRHVRLVMQRRIRDWSELAGDQIPDMQGPIRLIGPPKSTRAGMVLSPLARIWFAEPTWEVLETDAQVVAEVAQDPLAMGFASIGYDGEGVRYLGLRMDRAGPPAFPSIEEIESERYGLAKVVYLYYMEPPAGDVAQVLEYLLSLPGREAIEETKLWAVPAERAAVPVPQ
jgi:ABC-type phosphate transport system substrate-binding protein